MIARGAEWGQKELALLRNRLNYLGWVGKCDRASDGIPSFALAIPLLLVVRCICGIDATLPNCRIRRWEPVRCARSSTRGRQGCLLKRPPDLPTELRCNDEGGSVHPKPTSTTRSLSLSVFPRWMGPDWGCATASPETLTVKDKGRDSRMGARRNKEGKKMG